MLFVMVVDCVLLCVVCCGLLFVVARCGVVECCC